MIMKRIILILLLFHSAISFCQIKSGDYGEGLTLSYNPKNNQITGFYENFTGYDEETNQSRFSCIFYIQGNLKNSKAEITTYFPLDKNDDSITGEFQIMNDGQIQIKLKDDHGGCWNVQHFKDEFVNFALEKEENWIEIRYINSAQSYFYSDKIDRSKKRAYLVKGDIVYIDMIDGNWIHCLYKGKKTTKGWMKLGSVNFSK